MDIQHDYKMFVRVTFLYFRPFYKAIKLLRYENP